MRAAKILWASPFNMHDTSSGAALQTRVMLGQLASRGMSVQALGGMIFDSPAGMGMFRAHEEQLAKDASEWVRVEENGVEYTYLKTESPQVGRLTDTEQRRFFARFMVALKRFRPDVLLMYGGGCMEYALRAEAALHGIPCVYFVYNGQHRDYTFPYADLVLTDSQATAAYYARENHALVEPVGIFIEKGKVIAAEEQKKPQYVTFVNPVPAKGVSVVARLALMARTALPDVKFLVVQSRGRWQDSVQALRDDANEAFRLNLAEFTNVLCADHQTDMRGVYAASKVVLAPSLWYEGWGRVATEAVMNGVPVIASSSGGLGEAIGEGGRVVPCPQSCHANHLRLPTEEEVQPWLEALKDMLNPARTAFWKAAALRAAEAHDIERSTDRIVDALTPLLARRAGSHPQLLMRGSTNMV